jgi:hypothetical protein
MMYTSQEGELYVSQARALGAVGVLPKTVRPVDVSRVLYQLRLLPDRRQDRSALFDERAARAAAAAAGGRAALAPAESPPSAESGEPVDLTATGTGTWAVPTAALSEMQGRMQQSVNQLVRDQLGEQRRFMLATFEAFARRINSEIKDGIAKATPPPAEPVVPPPPPTPWWPIVLTGLLAVVPAAILGFLYWQSQQAQAGLARDLADAKSQAASAEAAARAALTPPPAAGPAGLDSLGVPRSGPPGGGPLAVEYVPYGEAPLANARLERLRMVATTLEEQQFRGRIVVESFIGDFCLSGDAAAGFTVAEATLPSQKCDIVGNPYEDALSPAQRQSVAFANFALLLAQRTAGAITVETVTAGRRDPIEYPEQREGSTAGEWNAVAAQNNRVEFHVVPSG